jgi:streptomycin 6-kinase
MGFFVPDRLLKLREEFDEEGARWLEALPTRVAAFERDWSLVAGRAFDIDGGNAWVAPVQLKDGSEAVLKVGIPHDEARYEGDALRLIGGDGAVRLLRASVDGYSLLLERCIPGTNLWSLGEEEGNAVGAGVLRRLWREPGAEAPFERLSEAADRWRREVPEEAPAAGYGADLVACAVALAGELSESQPRQVLLHGDFHPGNVLAAAREPWLAIDPKPMVGEPAYDLAQWLGNRFEAAVASPDPVGALRRQIVQMSALLELDPARVAGWAFVKALGWDFGPASARLLYNAMRQCGV